MLRSIVCVLGLSIFTVPSAARADQPVICPKPGNEKKECFNYVVWYWYKDKKEVVPVYGPSQKEADGYAQESFCSYVGAESAAVYRQVRRQKDGTVICQYGSL